MAGQCLVPYLVVAMMSWVLFTGGTWQSLPSLAVAAMLAVILAVMSYWTFATVQLLFARSLASVAVGGRALLPAAPLTAFAAVSVA